MHSALYGPSRRHTFAEGKQLIALSDRMPGAQSKSGRGGCSLIRVDLSCPRHHLRPGRHKPVSSAAGFGGASGLSGGFGARGAIASAPSARGRALGGHDGGPPEPHPYLPARGSRTLAAGRALAGRTDGWAGGVRATRPHAAPSSPSAPPVTRRARRLCMVVATCTQECAHCGNHTKRTGAHGVSVAGVSWGSPGRRRFGVFTGPPDRPAAVHGYDVSAMSRTACWFPGWVPGLSRGGWPSPRA
jgi:hypothetical protein